MIRPDGSVQHRLVGGDGLEAFIARVEQGFDEQNNLSALHSRYEKGGLSKTELFRYWEVLEEAGEDTRAEKVYAELLALLTDEEKHRPPTGTFMKHGDAPSAHRCTTSC